MANTSKTEPKRLRDIHYFRQRFRNRIFGKIASFFAEEAKRTGITKREIATKLGRDPAQITRWLSQPSNLTIETISDLLLALDAEPKPLEISRFSERLAPNYAHPLVATVLDGQTSEMHIEAYVRVAPGTNDEQKRHRATPSGDNALHAHVEYVQT